MVVVDGTAEVVLEGQVVRRNNGDVFNADDSPLERGCVGLCSGGGVFP